MAILLRQSLDLPLSVNPDAAAQKWWRVREAIDQVVSRKDEFKLQGDIGIPAQSPQSIRKFT
jgi:hypothetical protein